MAKTVPTAYATNRPTLGDVGPDQPIAVTDFRDVIRQQNYAVSRTGLRIGGMVFASDNPNGNFTTASATYTMSNATSPGRDLNTWHAISEPMRVVQNASVDRIAYTLQVFGAGIYARLTITDDTGGAITTITASNTSATTAWAEATGYVSTSALGSRIMCYLEVRASAGAASLFGFQVLEDIIPASNLPVG